MPSPPPILIIGAGITGLTLAQSLLKQNIPFQIFERAPSPASNLHGWGLTIHWALPALESCLPPPLFARLPAMQVDPQQAIEDTGRFLFLDLATAEPKFVIPPSRRVRVHRRRLRDLLCEGVDVQWGMAFEGFDVEEGGSVVARFEGGSRVEGGLLVGADGSSSRVRQLLFRGEGDPRGAELNQLPVRFMGVTVRLSPAEAQVLRDIDPLLFQGSHPETGVYLWYSTLSTPANNGSAGNDEEFYEGQLMMSWLAKSPEDEVPTTSRERVQRMKSMSRNFEARLRDAVQRIPEDIEVLEIKIQDWLTKKWEKEGVTLVGDSAHAMTMFRGEAFNHGITDAARLSECIAEAYRRGYREQELRGAVAKYEREMRERTRSAVLLSRQACLDAHDIKNLGPDSPLVSKRARVLEPAQVV